MASSQEFDNVKMYYLRSRARGVFSRIAPAFKALEYLITSDPMFMQETYMCMAGPARARRWRRPARPPARPRACAY
jgi:hypothetical protein